MRQFVKDEHGMVMGLVVITIVLIGVMGAGLLIFVQRDLNAVVEVNQGQKALEMADAGVQAAKRQLLKSSYPLLYDDVATDNSEWAFNMGTPVGKRINATNGSARVTIRYLRPPTAACSTLAEPLPYKNPDCAPEPLPSAATDYSDGRDYFRVESDGASSGALRKVQAIFVTEDIGVAKAYYATENINFNGAATGMNGVSFFAKGNVTGLRLNLVGGLDQAYGDWNDSTYNNKARLGNATLSSRAAGVAAEGSITYDPTPTDNTERKAPAEPTDRYRRIDYDDSNLDPGAVVSGDRFKRNTWGSVAAQPTGVVTYPFDPDKTLSADLLRQIAKEQIKPGIGSAEDRDNYYAATGGTSYTLDENKFVQISPPLNSVYVVEFTGSTKGNVTFSTNGGSCLKGTILIINGDLNTSSSGDKCFDGIITIQRTPTLAASQKLEYKNLGSFTLNGFVNAQGSLTIGGSVGPVLGADVLNQPGYHDVKLWSWRECYNTACT